MKFNFKTLAAFISLSALMTGCSNDAGSGSSPLLNTNDKTTVSVEKNEGLTSPSAENVTCTVNLSDSGISVNGSGAKVSGKTVNITSSGVYELNGTCSDCKLYIETDKNAEVTLVMNNASLTSTSGSVIDCEKAKTLMLYTNAGTENSLSDSSGYSNDDADAAVFTRSDLIIAGEGTLNINGVYGDAVKCKDAVEITGGKLVVKSEDDGITGKDSVTIRGGELVINSGGDGVKSTNDTDEGRGFILIEDGEINIESGTDGIQAETSLTVEGGNITIVSGGEAADAEIEASGEDWDFDKRGGFWNNQGSQSSNADTESIKGLKATGDLTITGGDINVKSADDSVHSNANVKITSGTLLLSSGDDGVHADGNLTITGGTITVTKSYEGLEGKTIDISGGVIDITAADDGINAASGNGGFSAPGQGNSENYLSISGGEITVSSNGDGIDSNGSIAQSGGVLVVYGPTNSANAAMDYDGSYAMSGGTLIALGSAGMAQAPSTLSQPCLSINANAAAGSKIEVKAGGVTILETTTPKAAQSLIFSCEEFKAGTEYEIYVGGELVSTVTAEEGLTGSMGQGGMGGFGGNHGGFGGGRKPIGEMGENMPEGEGGFNGEMPDGGFTGGFGGGRPDNNFGNRA